MKELKSFYYALRGIGHGVRHERHMQFHLLAAVVVVCAGWLLGISRTEWCLVVLCIGSVISAELVNTAIERLTDLASPTLHPLAGQAKDVAAGAVLIISIAAAIVGSVVFIPYLI